jgi:hypothetical protein
MQAQLIREQSSPRSFDRVCHDYSEAPIVMAGLDPAIHSVAYEILLSRAFLSLDGRIKCGHDKKVRF